MSELSTTTTLTQSAGPLLRVAHVTPTISRHGGGVWQFVRDLLLHSRDHSIEPSLLGLADDLSEADTTDLQKHGVVTFAFPRLGPRSVSYSPALARHLRKEASASDILHAHAGLRMWPNTPVRRASRSAHRPSIMTPHGMLYPWLLERSRLKKRLAGLLWDDANLRGFTALHATCMQEVGYIRDYGLRQPVAVVPAGVNPVPEPIGGVEAARQRLADQFRLPQGRWALFLGIMEQKKGLDRLAEAWPALARRYAGWHLVVAGPDRENRTPELLSRFERDGAGHVSFLGPIYGTDKDDLLAAAELFVLPTDWENFGIVIGEALAAGTPVITTRTTPWEWLGEQRAGWWIHPGVEPLRAALDEAMALAPAELAEMGARGREVVRSEYDWGRTVARLRQVYLWLMGQAERPEFVVI